MFLSVLQVSRVYVYLTYTFVLSWSLCEAMSAECAIIASDTAPVKEVIKMEKPAFWWISLIPKLWRAALFPFWMKKNGGLDCGLSPGFFGEKLRFALALHSGAAEIG